MSYSLLSAAANICLCFNPGGFDGVICVWNIITGQLVAKHSIGDVLSLKKAGRMADRACGNLAVTSMAYLDRRHAPEADYDSKLEIFFKFLIIGEKNSRPKLIITRSFMPTKATRWRKHTAKVGL